MNTTILPELGVRLSPLVRRITQDNPGMMTGPGTNTYLVGNSSVVVIDPGANTEEHLSAILREIGSTPVKAVAPTHSHPDHWPLAPRLARATAATTMGFAARNGYEPEQLLADGEQVETGEWTLTVVHTPGHASDHVSYYLGQERALFTGDHVMGWSTSVIARPDGRLNSYLQSLERLLAIDIVVIYPAHGEPVYQPKTRIEELIAHRHSRTDEIIRAMREGLRTIPSIVARVYADVDPRLHPMAEHSVLAHIDALVESGAVVMESADDAHLRSKYKLVSRR